MGREVWYNVAMIAYLLYNRQTPAEARVNDLARELAALDTQTELLDADSPRGVQLAEHYDVMGRPAVVLMREDDGSPTQVWQGEDQWPTADEVSYLAHQ